MAFGIHELIKFFIKGDEIMFNNFDNNTSYICPGCGKWIYGTAPHYCKTNVNPQEIRIIELLTEIRDLLKINID